MKVKTSLLNAQQLQLLQTQANLSITTATLLANIEGNVTGNVNNVDNNNCIRTNSPYNKYDR